LSFGSGADALAGEVKAGHKVLLVRPEVSRPLLALRLGELGAEVISVVFYRNVAAPGLREVARDICEERYGIIILTSPSSLERLLEEAAAAGLEIERALQRSALVTIGDVTAQAVRAAGLAVAAVADRPTAEAIAAAVRGLCQP
jgi:uroporphyrinogen-III synthase